jgi:hypothetical protein
VTPACCSGEWHRQHPHWVYVLSSVLIALTLPAISWGWYGQRLFPIRGFAVGGYACVILLCVCVGVRVCVCVRVCG